MTAALLGLVFVVSAVPFWKRALAIVFAAAGLAAIYLSQVRISLVITALMIAAYTFVCFRQGRGGRGLKVGLLGTGVLAAGFVVAVSLGGASVIERVLSLVGSDPISVYQNARGAQLSLTFGDLLYTYPLGAGLARWGMAAGYFGTFNGLTRAIWAEIQFTGWLLDGGILMIAIYLCAIVAAGVAAWRVAMQRRDPRLATCGAVVFSANLGVAALVFSFTPFVTQIGIQYWFLTGALHGIASAHRLERV